MRENNQMQEGPKARPEIPVVTARFEEQGMQWIEQESTAPGDHSEVIQLFQRAKASWKHEWQLHLPGHFFLLIRQ